MALPPVQNRLDAVNRVREHQRQWIANTRKQVTDGAPFAICNGDEAEEIFLGFDIPVLAINYWNFLIAAQGNVEHFTQVLNERGYAGKHFFALGLASSLAPEKAPWGGLPKPTIICGSGRSEVELRITELWARATGAFCFPLDFSFPGDCVPERPVDWWNYTKDRWLELVDPHRLDFRVEQERALIGFLEQITGRAFDEARLRHSLELVNEQMGHWSEAARLVARRPCPVHVRDQMSMYQAMWHRGTDVGVSMVAAYREEVEKRVSGGVAGYRNERIRLYFSGDVPAWSAFAEQEFGAVTVANFYSAVPDRYARKISSDDPVRTLAGRHLFLFDFNPEWIVHVATTFNCDAVVVVEPFMERYPAEASRERQAAMAAGLPYLALPADADTEDIRMRLRQFFEADRADRMITRRGAEPPRTGEVVKHGLAAVRAIRLRIMVPIIFLELLNSLDRSNVSFAALHMTADIGLTPASYGLGVGVFFVGFLAFQFPSVWLLRRIAFRRWLAFTLLSWGLVAASSAFIRGTESFLVMRFLLGAAEAGFAPGMLICARNWIPERYRALTISITMLAVPISIILGGPLSGWLMSITDSSVVAGWRWMFLIEGLPTILCAALAFLLFPDSPFEASWLSRDQKVWLADELSQEERALAGSMTKSVITQILTDRNLLLCAIVWFSTMVGAYTTLYWLPLVIKQLSHVSDVDVGLINALPWLALGLGMLWNGSHSDRRGERFWHVTLAMVIASCGFSLSALAGSSWIALLFLVLGTGGIGAAQGAFWAIPTGLLNQAEAPIGLVVVNVLGNLGGLTGPMAIGFLRQRSASFELPVLALSVALLLGAIAMVPLWTRLRALSVGQSAIVEGA